MIKPLNKIFLRIDTEASRKIKLENGQELFFDDKWEVNKYRQQIGEIAYLPEKYSSKDNETPLEIGDIVYFHHLASADINQILIEGEILYMQSIEQIFAVKKGDKIICLNDNVFIEQLKEPEENVKTKSGIWLKDKPDEIKNEGIVFALPKCYNNYLYVGNDLKFSYELKISTHVVFEKKKEYELNADFGSKKIYKMRMENILMVR